MLEQLADNIPPTMYNNLLFLPNWEEPINFFELSRFQKLALKNQLAPVALPKPSKTVPWVWFGAYSKFHAVFNNKPVTHLLMRAVGLPCEPNRRLVNNMTDYRSDVNPYKFLYGTGSRYQNDELYRKYHNLPPPPPDTDPLIKLGNKYIEDFWDPDTTNDPNMMQIMLQTQHIPPQLAKDIIRNHPYFTNPESAPKTLGPGWNP